jgi:hypothetical protein
MRILPMAKVTLASMLRRLYRLVGAVLVVVHAPTGVADNQRAIPDDNLAYPVLITINDSSGSVKGTGSGFYAYTDKYVYLVTAKHVLLDDKQQLHSCGIDEKTQKPIECGIELLSYSKDPADVKPNLVALDMPTLQRAGNIKLHPSQDVAVIKVFAVAVPPASQPPPGSAQGPASPGSISALPGVTYEARAQQGFLAVSLDTIKSFDQVLVGNDVIVFGYPTSLALTDLPQLDLHHPLLRKGIVAGSNPQTKSIFLDCALYFGNSGGPALEVDKYGSVTRLQIIGVVTNYIPFVDRAYSRTVELSVMGNSGYSMATPMDFVLELIK